MFDFRNQLKQLQSFVSTEQHNDCHLAEAVVDTPPCVSKSNDWEALYISLDRCSDETSGVISVSEEFVLQKNKIVCYRICTSVNMIHRYMPYKIIIG